MSWLYVIGLLLLGFVPIVAIPNTTVKQHLTICGILLLSVAFISASVEIAS